MKYFLFEENDLFKNIFPNTELNIDLKLLTRQPGHLDLGKVLPGAIVRDDFYHYTFVEIRDEQELLRFLQDYDVTIKRKKSSRNQPVYQGNYLNVNRDEHGTCRPFFKKIVLNEVTDIDQLVTHVCQELYVAWFSLRERGIIRN